MKIVLGLLLAMVVAIGGQMYYSKQKKLEVANAAASAAAAKKLAEEQEAMRVQQEAFREKQEKAAQDSQAESAAKSAVVAILVDPKSAEFRSVKVYKDAPSNLSASPNFTVCGEINSRNRMGGYVGFVPFMWTSEKGELLLSNGGEIGDIISRVVTRSCDNLARS